MVFIIINALHVSGCSSAHHQELKTVYTASDTVEIFLFLTAIVSELEMHSQLTHDSVKEQENLDKYRMVCKLFGAPDDGRRNRLKHAEHL
jgi:hypothetical protein